jgi:5-enolpyruvylshikimate-3-phosphate synthase
MGTVNKFVTPKLLDASNQKFNGQERVNAEIFTAIEILGRKLERTESERDRLARRLALMESAATVDETTGKLYLPVVVNSEAAPYATAQGAAKWTVMASLMSSAIALFALGIVLFRAPEPVLTRDPTERLLQHYGADLTVSDHTIILTPGRVLQAQKIQVPGDLSSAAFPMVAAIICPDSDIVLKNVGVNPRRTGLITLLRMMNASIDEEPIKTLSQEPIANLRVRYSKNLINLIISV